MITALLLVFTAQSEHPGFLPYSWAPAMGYASPVFMSVASDAAYRITSRVTDTDTYQRAIPPNDLRTIPDSSTSYILGSFGSGSILDESGYYLSASNQNELSWTWKVKAPMVEADQTLITYDYFIAKDRVSGVNHDKDSPLQTTVVQVNGSESTGGSG